MFATPLLVISLWNVKLGATYISVNSFNFKSAAYFTILNAAFAFTSIVLKVFPTGSSVISIVLRFIVTYVFVKFRIHRPRCSVMCLILWLLRLLSNARNFFLKSLVILGRFPIVTLWLLVTKILLMLRLLHLLLVLGFILVMFFKELVARQVLKLVQKRMWLVHFLS